MDESISNNATPTGEQELPGGYSPLTVDAIRGAALIGVGRTLFLKMHNSGRLPLPVRFGRSVRWRKQELVDWLNAGCPTRDRWKWKQTA